MEDSTSSVIVSTQIVEENLASVEEPMSPVISIQIVEETLS
jgi:hypothetical protein